jgi:hypothetical protein
LDFDVECVVAEAKLLKFQSLWLVRVIVANVVIVLTEAVEID